MSANEKGRTAGTVATPKQNTDSRDFTECDPVLGWYSLAKQVDRKPQRMKRKGGRHGKR
jgi:hypothetical protein